MPAVMAYALAVGLMCSLLKGEALLQFVLLLITTYAVLLLDKWNAILRIYSRMMPCSYVLLALMAGCLSMSAADIAVPLLLVSSYIILFRAYQDKDAPGTVFYAFLMIGMASLLFVQTLFFVPVLWFLLAANIMAMTARSFVASLLGLIMPYWIVGAYCVCASRIDVIGSHFASLTQFGRLFDLSGLDIRHHITFLIIAVLAATGIIHFYRNSFNDKIRTRMFFGVFTVMDIAAALFMALQPQHYDVLIGVMTVNTTPLIAHFLALTDTKATNCAFVAMTAAVLVATLYNIWMLS